MRRCAARYGYPFWPSWFHDEEGLTPPRGVASTRSSNEIRVRELLQDAAETLVERGYGDARIAGRFDRANVNTAQLFSTSAAASS